MHDRSQKIDPEIATLIERIVRENMAPFGYRNDVARAGEDHAGDPVIFVEVNYDLSENPVDLSVTSALTTTLRDRLWALGETRFPHIHHNFDDRQKVKVRGKVWA